MESPPRTLLVLGYAAAIIAIAALPLALRDPWFALSIVGPAALFFLYAWRYAGGEGWAMVPPIAVLAFVCGWLIAAGAG